MLQKGVHATRGYMQQELYALQEVNTRQEVYTLQGVYMLQDVCNILTKLGANAACMHVTWFG